jgi:hypothetical protein
MQSLLLVVLHHEVARIIQGLAPSVRTFLSRVSGNEAGDCPDSESDDEEEKPSQGFYTNPLLLMNLGHSVHVLMMTNNPCLIMKKTVISQFHHQVWQMKMSRTITDCIGIVMMLWKSLKTKCLLLADV